MGSTVVVLHAPKEEQVDNTEDLWLKMQDSTFIMFTLFVIIESLVIIFYVGPLYGKKNVIVYIVLCSSIGSITVMSCKGLGLALKEAMNGQSNIDNLFTWVLLFILILCIMVQMNYLNKSLDLFNTGIVAPIYYVFFTIFVIVASAILFKEWEFMSNEDIIGCICGFLTIIVAIFLLNGFKDMDVNSGGIKRMFRPKREFNNQYEPFNLSIEKNVKYDTYDSNISWSKWH